MKQKQSPSVWHKDLGGPGYSYELFPTFKGLVGVPRVPTEKQLQEMEAARSQDLTSKRNLKRLCDWTRGLQKEITKVVESDKPASERGRIISDLAETYGRVNAQSVRAHLFGQYRLNSGDRFQSLGVVAEDGRTFLVPPGERTVEGEARLHGKALTEVLVLQAFKGRGDAVELAREFARERRRQGQ